MTKIEIPADAAKQILSRAVSAGETRIVDQLFKAISASSGSSNIELDYPLFTEISRKVDSWDNSELKTICAVALNKKVENSPPEVLFELFSQPAKVEKIKKPTKPVGLEEDEPVDLAPGEVATVKVEATETGIDVPPSEGKCKDEEDDCEDKEVDCGSKGTTDEAKIAEGDLRAIVSVLSEDVGETSTKVAGLEGVFGDVLDGGSTAEEFNSIRTEIGINRCKIDSIVEAFSEKIEALVARVVALEECNKNLKKENESLKKGADVPKKESKVSEKESEGFCFSDEEDPEFDSEEVDPDEEEIDPDMERKKVTIPGKHEVVKKITGKLVEEKTLKLTKGGRIEIEQKCYKGGDLVKIVSEDRWAEPDGRDSSLPPLFYS